MTTIIKVNYILIFLLLTTLCVFAQTRKFNLFQIRKGEILRTDYDFLASLNYDLFWAAKLGTTSPNNYEYTSGIINLDGKEVFPFAYRGIWQLLYT